MTLFLTPIKLPIQDWDRILQLGADSRTRELQDELNRAEQAIAEFQRMGDGPAALGHLANTYAIAHKPAEAQNVLRTLIERANTENLWAYDVALGYAGLNDKDSALNWLEKAYQQRDPGINFLKVDPCLDPLRSDVRFQELIRRVGLSP